MSTTTQVSGAKIREARLRTGLTQAQLARAVNTSERNIVRWENDRNAPRMEHVAAIAKATGRELADFMLTGPDEEEADPVSLDDLLRLRVRQIVRDEIQSRRPVFRALSASSSDSKEGLA